MRQRRLLKNLRFKNGSEKNGKGKFFLPRICSFLGVLEVVVFYLSFWVHGQLKALFTHG